jgi:hypothetical protein
MPETANHLMFEGFVCFTLLFALSMQAGAARLRGVPWHKVWDGDAQGRHPLQGALLPLSAAFLMLYWLSVLHKLNYDFLDPEVSCASYMYRRVSVLLPFMPHARWAEYLAIWGTLLAEATVPALLLHRRTWRLGLVAALGFHLLLGFDPTPGIYSFTGLLYALFILLLPGTFVDTAGEQLERLRARVGRKPLLYVRIAGLVLWIGLGAARGRSVSVHALAHPRRQGADARAHPDLALDLARPRVDQRPQPLSGPENAALLLHVQQPAHRRWTDQSPLHAAAHHATAL